MPGPSFTIGSW
jgi:hypothetical protein